MCVCVCVCVKKKECKKITTEAFHHISCNFDHNKITVENIPNWHCTKNLDIVVYISEVVKKYKKIKCDIFFPALYLQPEVFCFLSSFVNSLCRRITTFIHLCLPDCIKVLVSTEKL